MKKATKRIRKVNFKSNYIKLTNKSNLGEGHASPTSLSLWPFRGIRVLQHPRGSFGDRAASEPGALCSSNSSRPSVLEALLSPSPPLPEIAVHPLHPLLSGRKLTFLRSISGRLLPLTPPLHEASFAGHEGGRIALFLPGTPLCHGGPFSLPKGRGRLGARPGDGVAARILFPEAPHGAVDVATTSPKQGKGGWGSAGILILSPLDCARSTKALQQPLPALVVTSICLGICVGADLSLT